MPEPRSLAEVFEDSFIDDVDDSINRQPVIRTGTREPICWHVRSMIKRRDHYRCRWCGAQHLELQIDHVKPWSAGGEHDSRNLQVLCILHNDMKGNRTDPTRKGLPGVVVECVRCREPESPTTGDPVWCFTCRRMSHDRSAWVDLAQRYLFGHCDSILRPRPWNREIAQYERERLLWEWADWYPPARDAYEVELRGALRELAREWRALTPAPRVGELTDGSEASGE